MLKLLNDSNFLRNTNSSKVFSIEYLNITIPIRAYNIKKKKKLGKEEIGPECADRVGNLLSVLQDGIRAFLFAE